MYPESRLKRPFIGLKMDYMGVVMASLLRTFILCLALTGCLFKVQPAHGSWNFAWDRPFAFNLDNQEVGPVWAAFAACGAMSFGYWLYRLWAPAVKCKEQSFIFKHATVKLRNYSKHSQLPQKIAYQKTKGFEVDKVDGIPFVFPDQRIKAYALSRIDTFQQKLFKTSVIVAPLGIITGKLLNNYSERCEINEYFKDDKNKRELGRSYLNVLLKFYDKSFSNDGAVTEEFVFRTVPTEINKLEETLKIEAQCLADALVVGCDMQESAIVIDIEVDPSLFDIYQEALRKKATSVVGGLS